MLDYIKTTFPVHFNLHRTKLQFGLTPIHLRVGQTLIKPQFHLVRTECLVVSSLRRTISQMGRTKSVTDILL
jgi:hypothetical protein